MPATTSIRVVCPSCRTTNAIAEDRDQAQARCGSCRAALFAGKPADISESDFDHFVSRSHIPVLVDIWAPWCGPCRAMAPSFAEAAGHLEPDFQLLKLNADEAPQICARYAIRGIPALLLFKRGKLVAQASGAMDSRRLVAWAREAAAR